MKTQILFSLILAVLGLSSCSQDCSSSGGACAVPGAPLSGSQDSSSTGGAVMPAPSGTATPTPTPAKNYYAPQWDSARREGASWSQYVINLVLGDLANTLLPGASDMNLFCPKYNTLNNDQRANFWAVLISAMSKYESGFDPISRMQETTMGKDNITGLPVYSEGLLQLSYGDIEWAPYCKFDWSKDKSLSPTDPRKTILNPAINLNCGVRILADQVKRLGVIAAPKNRAYWAVLIPDGKYTELTNIAATTKTMPGCQ